MAETVGVDFLLKSDTNTIGGKEDATLSLEANSSELAPTQTTGTKFARRLAGIHDWSIDFDALWIASSDALSGFAPTVTLDPSASPVGPDLKRISEVTLTIERNLVEFANSSHSQYNARTPAVVQMSAEVVIDVDAAEFYGSGNASRLLVDAWDPSAGGNTVDAQISLPGGNTSFDATWLIPTIELPTPAEDAAEATFTLESDGVITESLNASLGSGLNSLLTNLFADSPSALTALLSTDVTGNIEFTGDCFPSTIDITIPVEGSEDGVTTSGTVNGDGALTIQDTA